MANTRRGDPERALLVPLQRLRIGEVVGARHGELVEPAHVCSFGAPKRKAPASGGHGGERHDSARMAAKLIILSRLLQQKNEEALRAASVVSDTTANLAKLGLALLAQAGLAVGLTLAIDDRYAAYAPQVSTIVLASVVVYEMVGPIMTRFALMQSGEATVRRGPDGSSGRQGFDDAELET